MAHETLPGFYNALSSDGNPELRLQILLSTLPGMIYRCLNDAFWTAEFVSAGAFDLTGYRPDALIGKDGIKYSTIMHPDDRERVHAEIQSALAVKGFFQVSYRIITASGDEKWVWEQGRGLYDNKGELLSLQGYVVDITRQRNLEFALREKAELLDKARDAIIVSSLAGQITYWNKGAERLFGWAAEDVIDRNIMDLVIVDRTRRQEAVQFTLEHGDWRGEITKSRKDGKTIIVEAHYTLVRDIAGNPQSIFAIETDITERKAAEREIETLAFFDPLTELPNRRLLFDRLKHAIDAAQRSQSNGAVLFIDLDNFKTLNDTLGHEKGDLLLKQVAFRLQASMRKSNSIARLGGDEFVVMLEGLDRDLYVAGQQADIVAEKIIACFSTPFLLERYEHHCTPSIGIALFGEAKCTTQDVLKKADLAMYQAKAAGRNTVRFFDPEMQEKITERLSLEADFRAGLKNHQFFLQYQPQFDSQNKIRGVEALVRWRHHQRGQVSPGFFVPMAEETGLILPLGDWVLANVCRQLALWADIPGKRHLTISVNVSVKQFRHPQFIERLLATLHDAGASPVKLKIELTESLLLENSDEVIQKMSLLKTHGIRISLDDFGTGYSSLSYLKRLPLDQLKIDRSFVKDIAENESDAAIAQAIVSLGNSLKLEVIAEGVETYEQRAFLEKLGCYLYQGYLFSKPVAAADI